MDWLDVEDDVVDAAVLKGIKRVPQTFEQLQARLDMEPQALRASLYRLTTEGAAHYVYDASAWTLPKRRRKLTRKQAIGVLMEAAENWANELSEYIIPADDRDDTYEWEDNMSTTANRKEHVARIDEAVKLLTPKEKP
jgi:predicted ArsR family transcriptional regulator